VGGGGGGAGGARGGGGGVIPHPDAVCAGLAPRSQWHGNEDPHGRVLRRVGTCAYSVVGVGGVSVNDEEASRRVSLMARKFPIKEGYKAPQTHS